MATVTLDVGAQDSIKYEYKGSKTLQKFLEDVAISTNGVHVRVNGIEVIPGSYRLRTGDKISIVKNLDGNA